MNAIENLQMGLVALAQRLCLDRDCKAEGAGTAGTRQRPLRCRNCPLDAVDPVWDDFERTQP